MKSLPQSETKVPGVECRNGDDVFVITSNADRTRFTLWKLQDGYQKMQTAESPMALYKAIYGEQPQKKRRRT